MADHPTSDRSSAPFERSTAARLLNALAAKAVVSMPTLAALARVGVVQLEACRSGTRRLTPEEQMRVAAAIAELAPAQARRARLLYAQAQAELHFAAGSASRASADLGSRAARARERAVLLTNDATRLMAAATAFVAASRSLRASVSEVLRDEVEHFSVAARAAGEPPEAALVRLKTAIGPALAAVPDERIEIMSRTVDWFVRAYYAG
jgi:hypothetical protein